MKQINIILKKYLNNLSLQNKNTKYDGWNIKKYYIDRSQFINKNNDSITSFEEDLNYIFQKYNDNLLANGLSILGEKYIFECWEYLDETVKDGNRYQNPDGNCLIEGINICIRAKKFNSC